MSDSKFPCKPTSNAWHWLSVTLPTSAGGALKNPANDAKAMAAMLRRAGFEVIERENATRRSMIEAMRIFSEKLSPGGVAAFFYAGHGIQANGANYLMPVDVSLAAEDDLRYEALDVQDILNRMDNARVRLSLVILDACRDNPFARSFRSAARGFKLLDAPSGTFIAYATAPGKLAADGDGENGVYTAEVLKAMSEPGLNLEQVFKHVADAVERRTASAQTPWISSSFRGEFYFFEPTMVNISPPLVSAIPNQTLSTFEERQVEVAFWSSIQTSAAPADFEDYLARYPAGTFASLAQRKLKALKASPQQLVVVPPPPSEPAVQDLDATFIALRTAKIRSAPSATAKEIGTFPPETTVNATGRVGKDWLRFAWKGAQGFVSAPLLQEVDSAEVASWGIAKRAKKPDEVEAFLKFYPRGFYAAKATALLASLRAKVTPPAVSSLSSSQRYCFDPKLQVVSAPSPPLGCAVGDAEITEQAFNLHSPDGRPSRPSGAVAPGPMPPAVVPKPAPAEPSVSAKQALETGLEAFNRKDYAGAMRWYRKAADHGDALAQDRIGLLYDKGWGVGQDYAEAMRWYKKAGDQGNAQAQSNIGFLYRDGRGVGQDHAEAMRWYRKAADQGNAWGQYGVGSLYANGWGVGQGYVEAMRWYRKAADQGNALGQSGVGSLYNFGWGVGQDYAEAMRWYRKAADQGNAWGQYGVGLLYAYGWGVGQDYAEAMRWYTKAADQGFAQAQNNIGFLYDQGRGVGQDYAEAMRWYKKAADQGNAWAQSNIGVLYRIGRGVGKDYAEAMRWYRKAADQGNAWGQVNLGTLYANGQGVAQDIEQARRWMQKAATNGQKDYASKPNAQETANQWLATH
jgi:TPR repeat protein/uncharacterized caspase-like protein